jgi:glyoxylase-like metal-dependent hydrolase (beta-lactamase superfamily II)
LFAGDLFEREEDIANPSLWQYVAGSDDPEKQEQNRNKIIQIAAWIIPGHGPMFKVTKEMKSRAK